MEIIDRKTAIYLGLKRYYTGKPCKRGHIAEKSIYNGCIVCHVLVAKKWEKENIEKRRELDM